MSRIESPDLQLIELLRRSDAPTDEDMRRVGDAVGIKLAVGIGASTALFAVSRTSWAARLSALGTWTKGLVLATSLVGVGIGVTWLTKPEALLLGTPKLERQPALSEQELKSEQIPLDAVRAVGTLSAAPVVVPNAATSNTVAQTADSVASLTPAEPEPRVRTRATNRTTASTLEAELELLGTAQRALKSGQPNEALRSLDDHARRFPSGVLALERSGVRTVALCQAGRLSEGKAAARSYLRLAPNSVLSKRIRIACQLSGE